MRSKSTERAEVLQTAPGWGSDMRVSGDGPRKGKRMKIITLGTSHGACEAGRFCSAGLIQTENGLYLVDCGAPVEGLLTNLGYRMADLKAVFVTHMHEDHTACLTNVIKRMTTYDKDGNVRIFLPEEAGIGGLRAWCAALHMRQAENVSYELVKPGAFYDDGCLRVSAIPTKHIPGFPTYAFDVETEGMRVLFSGDLAPDLSDFPEVLTREHFDAAVLELTHYDPAKYADVLLSARADRLIFTHISPYAVKKLRTELFSVPAEIAADGSVFTVGRA